MRSDLYPVIVKAAKVLAALFLICVIMGLAFAWWLLRPMKVDYGAKPPAEVFRLVLNQAPPTGITNLKVAGHGFLMGHTVWMKCSATDVAIAALLKSKKLAFNGPDSSNRPTKGEVLQSKDALATDWDEVIPSSSLESYSYSFVPSGGGWIGEVVIDRKKHLVYVHSVIM